MAAQNLRVVALRHANGATLRRDKIIAPAHFGEHRKGGLRPSACRRQSFAGLAGRQACTPTIAFACGSASLRSLGRALSPLCGERQPRLKRFGRMAFSHPQICFAALPHPSFAPLVQDCHTLKIASQFSGNPVATLKQSSLWSACFNPSGFKRGCRSPRSGALRFQNTGEGTRGFAPQTLSHAGACCLPVGRPRVRLPPTFACAQGLWLYAKPRLRRFLFRNNMEF